jgi:formylglycine-generating enzyme required for sulfatase activity
MVEGFDFLHKKRRNSVVFQWKAMVFAIICLFILVGCRGGNGIPETPTTDTTPLPLSTEVVPTDTSVPPTATPTQEPHEIIFPDPPYELGDTLTRVGDGMGMVYVPGGTFEMGSLPDSDDWGPHTVTLDGFWIDQTEVTNAQFAAMLNVLGNPEEGGITWLEIQQVENAQIVMVGNEFQPDPGKDDHPVVEVSWFGAYAYCNWIGGRLPTEAEWEYAARGPENYIYPWGNEDPTCELAQFSGCGDYTVPVGTLSDEGASWVGAKDMAGNVWEMTATYFAEYPTEPQANPTGPETGEWWDRAVRGGSYGSAPDTLHTAYRLRGVGSQPNFGFRCAASSPEEIPQ